MERNVRLADGSEHAVSMCSELNGILWIDFITEEDFVWIVTLLESPERTAEITCYQVGKEESAKTYDGFVALSLVQKIETGYKVALRKDD